MEDLNINPTQPVTTMKFTVVYVCLILFYDVQGQFPFPGPRGMRCPDGRLSFRRCNGFDPNSCRPRNLFFCFAPADAGVCCRQRGRCPRPSRRPCYGFRRRRFCRRDSDCWFGQICCDGPCGRVCTYPRRF